MQQAFIFFILALVIVVSFIESVISYVCYGVVSTWYFISDYWLIGLAVLFGLVAFGGETKKQTASLGAIAFAIALFYFGDAHYITAKERSNAHAFAKKIAATYSHCGLEGNATVTCTIPISSFCPNNLNLCEEQLEEGMENWTSIFGPKHKNYALYRELDLNIRGFVNGGGSFNTYIQSSDGENVFIVRNEGGIEDFSIEKLM